MDEMIDLLFLQLLEKEGEGALYTLALIRFSNSNVYLKVNNGC